MLTPSAEAESLLSIEIGTIHTRALLFDLVDGQYRFLGASRTPSTYGAPYYDISEGVYRALKQLQDGTARIFLEDSRLVIPGRADGAGIDSLVFIFTAGPGLRIAALGLLENVSLESARRLAISTQSILVEAIGLNDHRKHAEQVDALLKAKPDLILIAGGTEKGSTRSVGKIADLVSMVLQLTPEDRRPEIMYAGNQAMQNHVTESLSRFGDVQVAPNVRPTIENEVLAPAQEMLARTVTRIRNQHLGGLQAYASITSAPPAPSSHTFGRMIRYFSQINNSQKPVLGVDLGASYTTLATAQQGNLELSVHNLGMGAGLKLALEKSELAEITRWLPMQIPDDEVRDYLWQKTLFPASIPATVETLAIEQAAARQVLALALRAHRAHYKNPMLSFEPVLVSGATLAHTSPAQTLLMLLDGLQPVGATTFVLDPYGLMPALGAAAEVNAMLPVQVVESNAFVNLGTVLSPVSNARDGTSIMNVRIEFESGEESTHEIRQGNLYQLPIQSGQAARIHLELLRPVEIDPIPNADTHSFKVIGGICGTVIDARGRSINLPADVSRRRDVLKKWAMALGG